MSPCAEHIAWPNLIFRRNCLLLANTFKKFIYLVGEKKNLPPFQSHFQKRNEENQERFHFFKTSSNVSFNYQTKYFINEFNLPKKAQIPASFFNDELYSIKPRHFPFYLKKFFIRLYKFQIYCINITFCRICLIECEFLLIFF